MAENRVQSRALMAETSTTEQFAVHPVLPQSPPPSNLQIPPPPPQPQQLPHAPPPPLHSSTQPLPLVQPNIPLTQLFPPPPGQPSHSSTQPLLPLLQPSQLQLAHTSSESPNQPSPLHSSSSPTQYSPNQLTLHYAQNSPNQLSLHSPQLSPTLSHHSSPAVPMNLGLTPQRLPAPTKRPNLNQLSKTKTSQNQFNEQTELTANKSPNFHRKHLVPNTQVLQSKEYNPSASFSSSERVSVSSKSTLNAQSQRQIIDKISTLNNDVQKDVIRQFFGDTETRYNRIPKKSEKSVDVLVLGSRSSYKSRFVVQALKDTTEFESFHFFTLLGQEDIFGINDALFQRCSGFILVSSVTSRDSFDEIERYRLMVQSKKGSDSLPSLLVLTDCGLPEDQWAYSRGEATLLANSLECPLAFADITDKETLDNTMNQFHKRILQHQMAMNTEISTTTPTLIPNKDIEVTLIGEEFSGKTAFIHHQITGEFLSEYSGTNNKLSYRKIVGNVKVKFVDTPGWIARPNNIVYSQSNEYEKGDFEQSIKWLRENSLLNCQCIVFMFTSLDKKNILMAHDFHMQINAVRGIDARKQLWVNALTKTDLFVDSNVTASLVQCARSNNEIFEQISVRTNHVAPVINHIVCLSATNGNYVSTTVSFGRAGYLLKGKTLKNCRAKRFVKLVGSQNTSCLLVGKDPQTCTKRSIVITGMSSIEPHGETHFSVTSGRKVRYFGATNGIDARQWIDLIRACTYAEEIAENIVDEQIKEFLWDIIVEYMKTDDFKGSGDLYNELKFNSSAIIPSTTIIASASSGNMIEIPSDLQKHCKDIRLTVPLTTINSETHVGEMNMGGMNVFEKPSLFSGENQTQTDSSSKLSFKTYLPSYESMESEQSQISFSSFNHLVHAPPVRVRPKNDQKTENDSRLNQKATSNNLPIQN